MVEIDLAEITEPILACPNDPDDVKLLSEVAGHEHRRRVPRLLHDEHRPLPRRRRDLEGPEVNPAVRTWICPPTRMDQQQLKDESVLRLQRDSAPG